MRIKLVTVAMAKTKLCPACGEICYYDRHYDFKNADHSDEMWHYRKCRLCGHEHEIKPRKSPKRDAKADKLNALMDELLNKNFKNKRH